MTPEERLEAARVVEANGAPFDVVLFWSDRPEEDGRAGRGCLSQWWPAPFSVEGVIYPTAEHWMMAAKARLFGDQAGLAAVMATESPGAAKAVGRRVRGFDEARWAAARYEVVLAGSLAKFGQHPELREVLLGTGRALLAEASPYDPIWGIGLSESHPDARRPSRWRGLNLLGFALMDARERLAPGG